LAKAAGGAARRARVIQITFNMRPGVVFSATSRGRLKMTRFCFLLMLMVLSSSADAGESFSFAIGGHHIRIEAPRSCNAASCVTVSIPGIYETHRKRDRTDDDTPMAAAKPAAPEPVLTRPAAPPPSKASIEPIGASPPPPAIAKPAACAPQDAAAPHPPVTQPAVEAPVKVVAPVVAPIAPPVVPRIAPPIVVTAPVPEPVAKISKVSQQAEDAPAAETPLGDWRTEGNKGSVRIEPCGRALCGYVLDAASNATGESVLINMKPTSAFEWSGNIYSRDSKNTYYATIAIKRANSLRVEACALGHFFCSGNVWSRIGATPERLITSRQISLEPRT
jgi:uncharacterized protein (DUF2147 family)